MCVSSRSENGSCFAWEKEMCEDDDDRYQNGMRSKKGWVECESQLFTSLEYPRQVLTAARPGEKRDQLLLSRKKITIKISQNEKSLFFSKFYFLECFDRRVTNEAAEKERGSLPSLFDPCCQISQKRRRKRLDLSVKFGSFCGCWGEDLYSLRLRG